jgi:23S rRNA (adenine2503-C2)-methyltransferase
VVETRGPFEWTRDEYAVLLADAPSFRVDQLWRGLWQEDRFPDEVATLPRALRDRLAAAVSPALRVERQVSSDGGQTVKWVFALADGATIETVLMGYRDRVTVCISTQAGCAMGCTFCATGQAGFRRHLRVGEVIEQVVVAARAAAPRRVSNVVFMGMGEPLANYGVTVATLRLLHERRGLSARSITVSTVGVVPAIDRLAQEGLPLTLAVSLHAANDADRSSLIPLNVRHPLADLWAACDRWRTVTGRRVSLEWALIDDVNDTARAADELVAFARPLGAHVNLIPLNPTPGYLVRGSDTDRVSAFRQHLEDRGVGVTVRQTRGRSIDAACGQLAAVAGGRRVTLRARTVTPT